MFLPIPSDYMTPVLLWGNPLPSLTKTLACLMWQMPWGICNLLLNPLVGLCPVLSHMITILSGLL